MNYHALVYAFLCVSAAWNIVMTIESLIRQAQGKTSNAGIHGILAGLAIAVITLMPGRHI